MLLHGIFYTHTQYTKRMLYANICEPFVEYQYPMDVPSSTIFPLNATYRFCDIFIYFFSALLVESIHWIFSHLLYIQSKSDGLQHKHTHFSVWHAFFSFCSLFGCRSFDITIIIIIALCSVCNTNKC